MAIRHFISMLFLATSLLLLSCGKVKLLGVNEFSQGIIEPEDSWKSIRVFSMKGGDGEHSSYGKIFIQQNFSRKKGEYKATGGQIYIDREKYNSHGSKREKLHKFLLSAPYAEKKVTVTNVSDDKTIQAIIVFNHLAFDWQSEITLLKNGRNIFTKEYKNRVVDEVSIVGNEGTPEVFVISETMGVSGFTTYLEVYRLPQ
jgi:hypothetical protein